MKIYRLLVLGLFAALVFTLAGCGGGGGGGTPDPTTTDSDGDGIPNSDDAYPNDPSRFANFARVSLPALSSSNPTYAVGVNDAAAPLIVGLAVNGSGVTKAVRWTVSGQTATSPTPLLPLGDGSGASAAYGVADEGITVGEAENGTTTVAVIWRAGETTPVALSMAGFGPRSAAFSINQVRQIVGEAEKTPGVFVPVLWNGLGADPVELPALGGAAGAAYFISNGGWIVGESNNLATVWTVNITGVVSPPLSLGKLSAGDFRSVALGVDNQGRIVGESEQADGTVRAVLWVKTGENYVISSLGAGASAQAINDNDRIAGYAGTTRAVVWDTRLTDLTRNSAVLASTTTSQSYGINQSDVVVGTDNNQAFAAVPQ
jgi:hypothetical protein